MITLQPKSPNVQIINTSTMFVREVPSSSPSLGKEHFAMSASTPFFFWFSSRLYQLYIIIALINTLTLYLTKDVKMDLELSAFYSSIVFQVSIVGKLLIGAAMDSKFQARGKSSDSELDMCACL